MNKGILIGISLAIIVGITAVVISSNSSEIISENSLDEEVSGISLENTKEKPKQFTVGLEESVGFTGG